ncbi:phytanoyl-CoA dioxygenase family protein [Microbacterium hydrocarbonoxydans]|uniref:phytanoyl-CoA dioxygenase family protein n=1 Tax=Microbacterium hydrocarbonoxydans TaxID=273678 RepID=UPI0020415897|nr:phytanoyl-CoA dioxygenase family protein [Microbacterium hydrocarbonoxydans]MCM3778501.1 phytanoyl-CoA dioxygenase family protein [Microbacterium hydrocarbonoxydans]
MITSNGYTLDESPARLGRLDVVPAGERGDREALWQRLRRDGYLFLSQHLDAGLVEDFRRYYFETLAPTGLVDADGAHDGVDAGGPVDPALTRRLLFDDIVPGDRYAALTTHPSIRGWFQWFLGDDVHLHKRRIIRHTRPGESGIGTATQAHYDLVYLHEGTDRVLSMWIPLGDCAVETGGLAYLEGSHHRVMAQERAGTLRMPAASITADLPSLAEDYDARWLVADYRAGDVMVHSAHIVHASTDNVDPRSRIRLSTDIRYQRVSDPIDWRWQEHWFEGDGL